MLFSSLLTAALAVAAAAEMPPGDRILSYLHNRGEALHIQTPSPVKAVYMDWRDVNWNDPGTNVQVHLDSRVRGPYSLALTITTQPRPPFHST